MSTFRKAERAKAKARIALIGVSGSGKTYSALLLARGLVGENGKIAVIDTENGSADLYSGLTDYDVATLEAPYEPKKYLAILSEAEKAGYDAVIIDSLSHAWAGEGGLLDMQGKIADGGGNSFAAWRNVTPWHNKLVDAIINSKCHIIATMRAKAAYEVVDSNGKKVPKKIGLAPVQRDGVEYEFTTVFDIDTSHNASASKDRTSLFDGSIFVPKVETGEQLRQWLESGAEAPARPPQKPAESDKPKVDMKRIGAIWNTYMALCGGQKDHAVNAIKKIVGDKPKEEWSDGDLDALAADIERRREEAEPKSMREETFSGQSLDSLMEMNDDGPPLPGVEDQAS